VDQRSGDRPGHPAHGDEHEHRKRALGDDEEPGQHAVQRRRAPQQGEGPHARRATEAVEGAHGGGR
jgi:hypothetical protein